MADVPLLGPVADPLLPPLAAAAALLCVGLAHLFRRDCVRTPRQPTRARCRDVRRGDNDPGRARDRSLPEDGRPLDPRGGTRWKNLLGLGMARVARAREAAHAGAWSLGALEGFHAPDVHPFWNESYYFNGCDQRTRDRVITRISHRGVDAARSFVFLLLDLRDYGALTLEVDDVDWAAEPGHEDGQPRALGLTYVCVDPMQEWRMRYDGEMRVGHRDPWAQGPRVDSRRRSGGTPTTTAGSSNNSPFRRVRLDLTYRNDTPTFWYMRDDTSETLAKNLSQEAWGLDFVRYCLSRSKNHCHIEAWGRLTGTVQVDDDAPRRYDFGTFRDHSWDIRLWAAIDQLFILLLTLEEPLVIAGVEYWYLDLTLVYMPGNSGGVQRYTTGWLGGKQAAGRRATGSLPGNLPVVRATSVLDVGYLELPEDPRAGVPARREPLAESRTVIQVAASVEQAGKACPDAVAEIVVECTGPIRRLQYWPDGGRFEVFEDSMDFDVNGIKAYGTRQSGFRVGAYDPSEGGCG